ncbi:S-layer homology domain-containing protein [Sinanaerobacter chloroacetimidivorans]|uniref:S-layer homology domain-containing protein n=1 Tax=Sinanaerobacter chloroacetimidivorans TaxID=2818044 RepID=A0A8J7W535_9FIRM|nr:S-layer homology domain-containing protein [Sinanaerobacter chloroacetimidivorans]MBR0599191.1 S-layer homology domain-containing protein [Sinanaerobacter chloroacetimidivorans]
MRMRKTISFVLVLALVLGSFSMAFASSSSSRTVKEFSDVEGTAYQDAVTVLSALNVVAGYPDGSYKPQQTVNRAEMAKFIITTLGLESSASGASTNFTDMSGYGWASGYVGYSQSLGIIKGYGDGTFRPGKTVSYDEAITMIVRALGYTEAVKEMNGTWPAVFTQKARVLGVTDDVNAGGSVGATRGDVAIMLYNALTCNMGYADADGVFIEKKDKDGHIIKLISNLDAEESEDYAVITKSDADDAVVNIRPYVGAYAKVFTLTKGSDEDAIIAVGDVKSTFVTGEYKAADKLIKTADGTEYKLDDISSKGICGTSKELDSKDTAIEFVNGETGSSGSTILDSDQQTLDTDKTGAIVTVSADVSGKTIKGIFSVLLWKADADEKVEADDLKDITSNHTLLGKDFAENDDDEIDVTSFELFGVKSLSDIKADNVVYVYANKDDEITRIAVGTTVAEGEITAIKEGSETKVTIGGKTYLFADEKLSKYNGVTTDFDKNDVDTGDEIKAYLDAYGYMYDYDAVSGKADNYAVVLEVGTAGTKIGDKNQIKLFLADGSDKVFDVDNDLFKASDYVPGVTTTDAIKWEVTGGSIVKYGVDKDGVIDSFENLKDGKDYTTVDRSGKQIDITAKGYYDNTQIRTGAVIFSFDGVPGDGTDMSDEDNYGVTTLEKVLDTSDVRALYVTDSDKIAAMLLYDYSGSDEVYGVVTEAKKTSGDSDYQATLLIDGAKKTYGLSSESVYSKARDGANASNNTGDKLFKLEFNASGEIKGLVPAWTDSADTYATEKAIVADASKSSFSNNTYKYDTLSVKLEKDAVVYKNDSGDFKTASTSDLKNLKNGATVWFYDTNDDNNDGLMNIIVIDNPGTDSDTSTGSDVVTVTYVNSSATKFTAGGTTYTINDDTKLLDKDGNTIGIGSEDMKAKLTAGDKLSSIKVSNGVVTSMKQAE